MQIRSGVQLGSVANLLFGYRPGWNPADPSSSPFFGPEQGTLHAVPAFVDDEGEWGLPLISLHDTPESVLSKVYDLRVKAESDENPPPLYPSGALLLNHADSAAALAALKEELGIDFAIPDRGYALVELRREQGTDNHITFDRGIFGLPEPERVFDTPFRKSLVRLRPGLRGADGDIESYDDRQAQGYLDHFYASGTHYVSHLTGGDKIYQIFAYDKAHFAVIKSAYAKDPKVFEGQLAWSFAYYTRPVNEFGFGDTAEQGKLCIASRDPVFTGSVADGEWRDNQWAKADSIFAPSVTGPIDLARFTKVVPIIVELTPLGIFAEHYRKMTWRSVFKAAMYTVFGDAILPAFEDEAPTDFRAAYPQMEDGLLSTIATPVINTYKTRFDLPTLQLAMPDQVQTFTLLANLLEVRESGAFALPGKRVTLMAHVLHALPADGKVPTLTLGAEAFQNLNLACQQFYGSLNIVNTETKAAMLVADGLLYQQGDLAENKRRLVTITGDIRQQPSLETLQTVTNGLQYAVAGADALLTAWQAAGSKNGQQTLIQFLNWVAEIIPQNAADELLQQTRLDALYLARAATALAEGARRVPYLTYATYKPLVESIIQVADDIAGTVRDYQTQIRMRRYAELQIKSSQELNQNIIQTGQLLTGYIGASAAQQRDLAQYYGQIAAKDQASIQKTADSIKTLSQSLDEQRMTVQSAVEHYKTAVAEWERNEIIKFSLDLAINLFSLGFAVVTPSTSFSALKDLGATAQKIQQFVKVLEAIQKLQKALEGGIKNISQAEDALSSLDKVSTSFPSSLEWNEFRANMKLAMSQGPAIPEKAALENAFDILVLRGQALLNAQSKMGELLGDMYMNQRRQAINNAQADRLDQLKALLQPQQVDDLDRQRIDLIGLTGALEFQQRQMLLQLIRTLVLQDQALQYEYMQPATPITTFDLLALKVSIASQNAATINALQRLSPPPERVTKPITYTIDGVPVSALTGGSSYRFSIPVSAREFFPYTMVRIARVVAAVGGVKATESGEVIVRLGYSGEPFEDRDQNRNVLTFYTVSREFDFLYDAATGEAKFGGGEGAFSGNISRVTPFSEWEIAFPKVRSNRGITFAGSTVSLTLTFDVVAQLNDAPALMRRRLMQTAEPGLVMTTEHGPLTLAALGDVNPQAQQQELLSQMFGRSVLKGWDVVFNYTEQQINALLLAQYNNRKENPDFVREIPVHEDTYKDATTGATTYTTWGMKLGAPRLQFLTNNSQYVQIFMEILSGSYEYGVILDNGQRIPISKVPSLPPGKSITGNVALGKLTGAVEKKESVVVNLAQGAFDASQLEITIENPLFNGFVTRYFQKLNTQYVIGAVDYSKVSLLDALTPRKFFFHVLRTNSGKDILQLFIATTTDNPPTTLGVDVNEPIPGDYQCSLMISTRILFNQIMPQGFTGNSQFKVTGVDPGTAYGAWSALVQSGSITGHFVSSNNRVRISEGTDSVPVDMAGMTFTPNQTSYQLDLKYDQTTTRTFQYKERRCMSAGEGMPYCWDEWTNHNLDVRVQVSGVLPVVVQGSGMDQKVQIQAANSSIPVDGNLAPSGACECNDRQLQQEFLDQLRSQLPGQISKQVDVPFHAVSLFALKSLLFPEKNIVDLRNAYTPGDMVIFGNFVQ